MTASSATTPDVLHDAAQRFTDDTADHQLTVLHDDGLYRHLRFKRPGTSMYHFDLITWPGTLVIRGDCESHMFSREADMFTFFRGQYVNVDYWAEKTPGGRYARQVHSERQVRQIVAEHLGDVEPEWPGITEAWAEHADVYDLSREDEAHLALRDFTYTLPATEDADRRRLFTFSDTWEWNLREYDFWFVWCCHAVQWGIAQYDARAGAASAVVDVSLPTGDSTPGGA